MKIKTITTLLTIVLTGLCHAEPSFTVKNENGVRIVTNQNRAADSTFRCGVKLVAELTKEKVEQYKLLEILHETGAKHIFNVKTDSKNNLYFLGANKVIKLSPELKFITQWGKIGSGPGEFKGAYGLFIYNDTIFIQDQNRAEILKFDTNGKYLSKKITGFKSELACGNFGGIATNLNDGFIAPTRDCYDYKHSGPTFYYKDQVASFDKYFNKKKVLFERKIEFKQSDRRDFFVAAGSKEFAVVENDYNAYLINLYDINSGKLKTKIRRGFKKIENPDKLITYSQADTKSGTVNIKNEPSEFLEPIIDIFYDKFNRLWAISRSDTSMKEVVFDVFMNGILMKKVTLPWDKVDMKIYFFKDRILFLDRRTLEAAVYEIVQ